VEWCSFRTQIRLCVGLLQSLLTFEHLSEYERDESRRDVLWNGVVWGETEAHDYADQHHDFRGHKNLPSVVVEQEKYVEIIRITISVNMNT
jgi:hypothetical protein